MDGFLNLMEFSIALAGFTSIVVTFVHRDEKWEPFDKFRVQNGLIASLGAAFLSAVPIGLQYFKLESEEIWVVESLFIALYLVIFLTSVVIRIQKQLNDGHRSTLPKGFVRGFMILGGVLVLLLLGSAWGILQIPSQGLSYFSIIYLLLMSAFAFIRIIFYRPK